MRPPFVSLLVLAAFFSLLLLLEYRRPLRRKTASLLARLLLNLAMSFLAFVTAGVIVRPSSEAGLNWGLSQGFGLFHWLKAPLFVQFLAGFALLDLSFYWWHVVNHRVPFLWRFHNVHHIDPDLDVSTGFRFHFGEVGLSTVFRVAQVILIGVSAPVFAAYEVVFQANTLFHHSNLRLPIRLERWLNKVLVTPRMHGIHHSQLARETNSNYGVVFPWWDRFHRTLGVNIPQRTIHAGVPAYTRPEDNRFLNVILMPFRKQPDYWRYPDGTPAEPNPGRTVGPHHELAE